jgi:hypothetical protein
MVLANENKLDNHNIYFSNQFGRTEKIYSGLGLIDFLGISPLKLITVISFQAKIKLTIYKNCKNH